ncbi:hypothetical protein [Blastomonas sp.]|uniref:hypothetical protein n=1 Tax=Blastomonas sp. TaxID=1909299 RepID=UPI00391DDA17
MSENGNQIDGNAATPAKKPRAKKAAASAGGTTSASKQDTGGAASPAAGTAAASTVASAPAATDPAANTGTALAVADTPAEPSALGAAAAKVGAMIPDSVTDKARDVAGDVKDKASDAVLGLARIISDSAGAIDDNVGPKYGDYARTAAQSVSDAAERLRAKPVDEIAEETREFVRTKPAAALGIAAVAGLVLTRIFGSVFGKKR